MLNDLAFAPIFIVGHPRSGSTLLASLLGEHTKIAALPETHFVRSSIYGGTPLKRWMAGRSLKAKVELIYTNVRLPDAGIESEEFTRYCQQQDVDPRSSAQLLRAFLQLCRERGGKDMILEKTPGHIAHVNEILKWIPQAKIIFTVRDARDAVSSLLRVKWTHSNPKRHAAYWAWCVRKAISAKTDYPGQVYIARYEDLVQDPERSLRDMCDFLGVEYQEYKLAGERAQGVVPTWEMEWKRNSMSKIDPAHANQWMKSGDPGLNALVERIAHAEMVSLGYVLSAPERYYTWRDRLYKGVYGLLTEAGILYREYLSGKKNRFRERTLKHEAKSGSAKF